MTITTELSMTFKLLRSAILHFQIERTDAEAEALITLTTWCKEPTHWKRPSCWERLKAGGEGDDRGCLDGITDSMDMSLSKLREMEKEGKPGVLQFVGSQRVGHDWATEQVFIHLDIHLFCPSLHSHFRDCSRQTPEIKDGQEMHSVCLLKTLLLVGKSNPESNCKTV